VNQARRRALVLGVVIGLVAAVGIGIALSRKGDDTVHLSTPGGTQEGGIPLASNQTGKKLPKLSFTRFDGTKVDFAAVAGKPLVVNVWSETCVPCKDEMPAFEKVHQSLGDKVAFVGLDNADDLDRAEAFVTRTSVTYDIWRDPGGDFVAAMKVAALPTTFFVSPDGTVLDSATKALTADELTAKLLKLFP
jgi:thiol-disulfide isomerase/thioredoxin